MDYLQDQQLDHRGLEVGNVDTSLEELIFLEFDHCSMEYYNLWDEKNN